MHFVMYASSNRVRVLHNVTPIDLLDQSAALFCPNALCLYRQSILSILFTVTMIWWRGAGRFV